MSERKLIVFKPRSVGPSDLWVRFAEHYQRRWSYETQVATAVKELINGSDERKLEWRRQIGTR